MRWPVAVLVTLFAWLSTAGAAPTLHRAASGGRITIFAEPGLESTAQELAAGAEATLARISEDLVDLPVPPAVEVRLVREAHDLAAVAPAGRGAPSYAVGVAYPDRGIISVALRRDHEILDARSTLDHELAHIALGVALGDRAPHWLHEGFAYQHSGEWSWDRMETLAGMAWFGGIIELNELDSMFPQGESPTHRAYAESYDFVGFLSRRGRWDDKADDGDRWPFRRFLTHVGRTGDIDAAAKTAFGRPLHELFEEWRADLTKRYMLVPIGLLGLGLWILCALLLVFAWWRRRRQNRRRIEQWDEEERQRRAAAEAPAYFANVGEEPLVEPGLPPDDERLN